MSTTKPHMILDPFKTLLRNASISDLDDLHVGIMDFGDKYPATYRRLVRVPFVRHLFNAIDEEIGSFYDEDDEEMIHYT